MNLEALGFNVKIKGYTEGYSIQEIGRVIEEHKERYVVQTVNGTFQAEVTGNLRFTAASRNDFPTVGDWVIIAEYDDGMAVIFSVLPRYSLLARQAVGKHGEHQPIAANVDTALIMQSVGHDFNLNRLDRYLAICNASSIEPIIILSKTDLIPEVERAELTNQIKKRISNVAVIAISNITQYGYEVMNSLMIKGRTYCILGSSGVGKSSLTNNLLNKSVMEINDISTTTNKGQHTTSHRALFILDNGSIIIDTPGMRELGITDSTQGIDQTFDAISRLADHCKFNDCTHTSEVGCAVIEAMERNEIDSEAYENYMKLKREQQRFASTIKEKRDKDKKQGKLYKRIQEMKRKNKY